MVAGDHHRTDAGSARQLDGLRRLRPGRVDHAQGSEPDQLALELGSVALVAEPRSERAVGEAEGPQGLGREAFNRGRDLPPPLCEQGLLGARAKLVRAAREQHVGRPLGHQDLPAFGLGVDVGRAHELALGREGDLAHAQEPRAELTFLEPRLLGRHLERAFGGIAPHRPGLPFVNEGGVVGEHARAEKAPQLFGVDRIRDDATLHLHFARGVVAVAGELGAARGRHHRPHRHLVAGEGAGLVRADDRGRAQSLDRGQASHHGAAPRHTLGPQGKDDGGDSREAFGHRGHGEGDTEEQHVEHGVGGSGLFGPEKSEADHGRDQEDRLAQEAAHAIHLALQGRHFLARLLQQARDVPQLALHAGGGDHRPPAPAHHGRAGENHVDPIGQAGIVLQWGRILGDRGALAGQRGLGGAKARRLEEARVRGHRLALLEQQDVAGHDLGRGDGERRALAEHEGVERGEGPEGMERALGSPLLEHGENRVRDHHGQYGECLVGPAPFGLEVPHQKR